MVVAWHFPANGNHIVMSLPFTVFGRHSSLLIRLVLIAKCPPVSRHSPSLLPLQKKVYLISVRLPSFANLVSLRAALWMRYLFSSLATRAVLPGLLDFVLSISVHTFHVPMVSKCFVVCRFSIHFIIFVCFDCIVGFLNCYGNQDRVLGKQTVFRALFLAPFLTPGDEQCNP